MEDVYGIDLGTTNSCIATIGEDGQPEVIKNLDDQFTTPSVVFYDDAGEPYVGSEAKSMMGGDIKRTVAFIKREMSNKAYKRTIDDIEITPTGVSALILKKVVDDANEQRSYEGLPPIHKAVITVPAYFGGEERERTKQAAQIAGIEVLGLLNEPTAAALSYGTKGLEGKTFMIYDLGGGTFDVSIMRMKNGVLDTLATNGDHQLGGVDWDIRLIDYMLQSEKLGVTYDDIKDEKDVGKLLAGAEICKKNLSRNDKATMKFVYKRSQHIMNISRGVFEELTEELVDNTIDIVEYAKRMAREPIDKIDEIILVGGSSYMPMIKKRLMKEYPGCNIRLDNLEPDRAVAKGAAIHAANIVGNAETKVELGEDMASRSYGLYCIDSETGQPVIQNLVKRTDPMVYSASATFSTMVEGQTAVDEDVYENVSVDDLTDVNKSTLIESKKLSWGFPVPKDTDITAHVNRDKDGLISITVECQGKSVSFEIKPSGTLSEREIEIQRQALVGKRV